MSAVEVRELFARMGRARTLGLAAEMSFFLFLALIPLAVVAGLLAAKLALRDPGGAVSAALGSIPAAARDLISEELAKVAAWNGGAVAPTAIVGFLWLASSGVHATFDAIEAEVGCSRPWWKKRLVALGACVLLGVGVALVTLLGTGLDWIWRITGTHLPAAAAVLESSALGHLARLLLGALVTFGLAIAVFLLGVPATARARMPLVPGAILTVVLEVALGLGYGFYLSKAGTGSAYEAGLAAVGVTMTALYLASLALLVGLELNLVLRDRRANRPVVTH